MKENPYSKLLEITKSRQEKNGNVLIGEIISVTPLTIMTGDLQIDKDEILIDDYLLYSEIKSFPIVKSYTDGINVGDRLAMLQTADKQLYIIIARVRRL